MDVFLNKKRIALPKFLIGIVFLLILVAGLNLFAQNLRNIFYSSSSPLQQKFWRAGESASGFIASFLNAGKISAENFKLREENQALLAKVSNLQEQQQLTEAIRGMILSDPERNFDLLAVEAIGFDTYQNSLLINKGALDGVSENMAVINAEKVLFGKVSEVYKNFSKIVLISDKNSVVDVKILNEDPMAPPVYGVIKGDGKLGLFLDLIPFNCEINENDTLVTSALEGIFPKGLLVGRITACFKDDQKPFQQAKVQPFFDAKTANKLFVILDYKKE